MIISAEVALRRAQSILQSLALAALVALTLTPVMASKILNPKQQPGWLASRFDAGLERLAQGYRRPPGSELSHSRWAPGRVGRARGL